MMMVMSWCCFLLTLLPMMMLMMLMLMAMVVFIGLPLACLISPSLPTLPITHGLQARVKNQLPPPFPMILKQEVARKCKNIQNILC